MGEYYECPNCNEDAILIADCKKAEREGETTISFDCPHCNRALVAHSEQMTHWFIGWDRPTKLASAKEQP